MKNLLRDRQGFTTIELMVVVSIIAILSAIVLTSMSGSRGKSRDATRVSDLHQLQLALALYFDRCGQYPSSLALTTGTGCPSGVTLGSFIVEIPTPPAGTPQTSYATGYYTRYISGGRSVNYVLTALLESQNAALAKGLNASSVPDAAGPWSLQADQPPFLHCSKTNPQGGYYYYCIGPN